jgi:hypothetical protein
MIPTQSQIEAAAPDQASLKAALKLVKPASWPVLHHSSDETLIWGDCQGSGANPYRVVVDTTDFGAKCSCPSRKFPCKHALGLMLLRSGGQGFSEAPIEAWIVEWMGRRRKTDTQTPGGQGSGTPGHGSSKTSAKGNLKAAMSEVDTPLSDEENAKREVLRLKRDATTRASISSGLLDLEAWVSDQLAGGIPTLQSDLSSRCRQIAARMVDAKAGALASRIDELPSRVLALPTAQRLDALVSELGNLVLLSRTWSASEDPSPSLRRAIASSETREAVFGNADAPRKESLWKVIGTRVQTRRDGLVSTETWLIDSKNSEPDFALLLDFTPAGAGKRSAGFSIGDTFYGRLVFYPSDYPLRAQIETREANTLEVSSPGRDGGGYQNSPQPSGTSKSPLDTYAEALVREPWITTVPLRLPCGRISQASDGKLWWKGDDLALPLDAKELSPFITGYTLEESYVLWSGFSATFLSAKTAIGEVYQND